MRSLLNAAFWVAMLLAIAIGSVAIVKTAESGMMARVNIYCRTPAAIAELVMSERKVPEEVGRVSRRLAKEGKCVFLAHQVLGRVTSEGVKVKGRRCDWITFEVLLSGIEVEPVYFSTARNCGKAL